MYTEKTTKKSFIVEHQAVPKESYNSGDIFVSEDNTGFMLAVIGPHRAFLVRMSDGNRWTEAIKVEDVDNITKEEFKSLSPDLNLTKVREAEFKFTV